MKEFVEHIRTGIYLTMCVLFSILVYIYIDYILKHSTDFWIIGSFMITAVVVIDYLSRRYVTNLFMFFFIHIIMVAAVIIIPPSVMDKIVLGGIAFSYLILSVGFWQTESNERSMYVIDIPVGLIMFFVMAYMHASASKEISDVIAYYAYIAGVVYFILYFVRGYLSKFLSYTLTNGNFTKEMRSTFTTNFSLIMLFNLVVIFVIMLSNIFFSDSMFNFIGRFLRFLARKFFGYLAKIDTSEPAGSSRVEIQTGESETVSDGTFSYSVKGSEVGEIIFKVITIMIFIAAICAVLWLVYRFIKQYLHRHNKTTDIIAKVDFEEEREKVESKRENSKRGLFMSNRDRVRKLYVAYINGIRKKSDRMMIRDSFTTEEILDSVSKCDVSETGNIEKLTSVYKKARYSDHEITREDVELAKLKA